MKKFTLTATNPPIQWHNRLYWYYPKEGRRVVEKWYVIGRGTLGGCWADSFWHLTPDGLDISGGRPGRKHLTDEKKDLIADYYKYRKYLEDELKEVIEAEHIVLNMQVYPPGLEAKILGDK